MPIYSGSTDIQAIYSGSTEVQKVYSGSDLVWSNVPNINFAPDGWTVGEAGTIWTIIEDSGFVNAFYGTTYVNLNWTEVSFSGDYSSLVADDLSIQPSTSYSLFINVTLWSGDPTNLRVRVIYKNGGSTVSSATLGTLLSSSGTGLEQIDFTTPSGTDGILIELRALNTGPISDGDGGDVRFNSVYLELA